MKVCTEALECLFGRFTPSHAFLALSPDWGITLTEPMATRGLAHLRGRGSGSLKAQRFRAFLEALRIPDTPDSLRAYYDNGNKAVGRAVDALTGKLNGADMPDCDWKEAQNYNQALLMTAQVRADYVALLDN